MGANEGQGEYVNWGEFIEKTRDYAKSSAREIMRLNGCSFGDLMCDIYEQESHLLGIGSLSKYEAKSFRAVLDTMDSFPEFIAAFANSTATVNLGLNPIYLMPPTHDPAQKDYFVHLDDLNRFASIWHSKDGDISGGTKEPEFQQNFFWLSHQIKRFCPELNSYSSALLLAAGAHKLSRINPLKLERRMVKRLNRVLRTLEP